MDHILPHQQYKEYSVHARNLIPCCTDCNRRKDEEEILNLYTDILPEVEYLFMDVQANGDTLSCSFRLDNSQGFVHPALFARIMKHYNRLSLFDRMKDMAESHLTRFVIQINKQYFEAGKDSVVDTILEEVVELRKAYGFNYWEAAFKKGLIDSPIFWAYYVNGSLG